MDLTWRNCIRFKIVSNILRLAIH